MKESVYVKDIIQACDGKLIYQGNFDYVKWVISSGLMSDVLTTDEEEVLLLTNLTTTQVIRTADMIGANAVMISNRKAIPQDTINMATELGITVVQSYQPIFETCCLLSHLFIKEK